MAEGGSRPVLGVSVSVLDGHRILMTLREDFHVWCLPGGQVDACESLAQAARREVHEETGLDVEIVRLVGCYSTPHYGRAGTHVIHFAARVVGGELRAQADEVLDLGFFDLNNLPEPLYWQHRQRILDALSSRGESHAWLQDVVWPLSDSYERHDLYRARDASGLTRQGFYLMHMSRPGPLGQRLEAGPTTANVSLAPDGHRWPLHLETERLLLREFVADDWQCVLAYQQDPRYQRFYGGDGRSEEQARAFVQRFVCQQRELPRQRFQLAIECRGTPGLIGNCGLRLSAPGLREADIGYELDPAHWGQGYATEAMRSLLGWGFEHLGLHRAWAWCLAENVASQRVLERLGLRCEGCQRQREFLKERWRDVLTYAILDEEWAAH